MEQHAPSTEWIGSPNKQATGMSPGNAGQNRSEFHRCPWRKSANLYPSARAQNVRVMMASC